VNNDSRKASDVLIAIEAKIDQLISLVRSHDLNMKIMSNKLNGLISEVNTISLVGSGPKAYATTDGGFSTHLSETLRAPESLVVKPEDALPVTSEPVGFRRTSRPETYIKESQESKDSQIINQQLKQNIFNDLAPEQYAAPASDPEVQFTSYEEPSPNKKRVESNTDKKKVPVIQRVVDKTGKSVFLAEVEIVNSENGDVELKTRTNGVGKWQASLNPGKYKVKINKRESLTKEKIEITQNVTIDGLSEKQELPAVIVK
jgi:hypothetical protein